MAPKRAPKRPREEQQDAAVDPHPAALRAFEAWMAAQGITLDSERIVLRAGAPGCSGPAWGVFAEFDLEEGDHLCTIPKTAILSVRTTAFAEMIETERLGGGLGLIVAVMAEATLGAKSKWHGYLQSLPAREYLPIFWTDEELQLLQGTELEAKAQADREATEGDFEADVKHLADKYKLPKSQWTLDHFRAAASWVASRAFYVDRWNGNSMVPLADIFNHKAAIVELADGFAVAETADAASDEEGGEDEGEEEEGEEEDEEGEDKGEDEEGDEEGGDAEEQGDGLPAASKEEVQGEGNASACDGLKSITADGKVQDGAPSSNQQWRRFQPAGLGSAPVAQLESQPRASEGDGPPTKRQILSRKRDDASYERDGLNLRLEIGICSTEQDGQEVLEIVAASAVRAGREVHNTYGEHGNAELVNKYGFALERNPFDEVSVPVDSVVEAATQAVAADSSKATEARSGAKKGAASASKDAVSRRIRRRMRLISAQSSLLDPGSEPLLVMPGGCVSRPLLLLLYVLLAPDEQAQAWGTLQDAMDQAIATQAEPSDDGASFDHAVKIAELPSSTLTPLLRAAFRLLFTDRLSKLPGTLKETRAALKAIGDARSEHATAVRAALTLRLTEQQALQDALDALRDN